MARLCLAILLALLAAACQDDATNEAVPEAAVIEFEADLVAYTNAIFWDGTGNESQNGVMVVRAGRIESLGTENPPAGARVVDLGGAFVVPGLINTHGHVSGRWADASITDTGERVVGDLELLAKYGVTTVNSLGNAPEEAIAVRDRQDSPTLRHARLYVAGPVIAETDPGAAAANAQANIEQEVDWLKLRVDDNLGRGEKMSWEAVQAVIDAGEAAGVPVATHMFYLDDASRLLEMGSALLAHSVRDQPIDDDFIESLADSGVCYVPTLTREVSTFAYTERPEIFRRSRFFCCTQTAAKWSV